MTIEQENEYAVLKLFLKEPHYYVKYNLMSLFNQEVGYQEANRIFNKFCNNDYMQAEDDLTIGSEDRPAWPGQIEAGKKYSLSPIGLNYFSHLLELKKDEVLLKEQTQSVLDTNESVKTTNKIQRGISWVTLAVALVAAGISVLNYFKKEDKNIYLLLPPVETKKELRKKSDTLIQMDQIPDSLNKP